MRDQPEPGGSEPVQQSVFPLLRRTIEAPKSGHVLIPAAANGATRSRLAGDQVSRSSSANSTTLTDVTHPDADVIVPPCSSAGPSDTAEAAPTQRDRHLQRIAKRGRLGWQRTSGYNFRALVEANISRWKCVIGDGLRSQTDRRQRTEMAIAVGVLNCMLEFDRPKYVRTA